ncbi:hypothetical protein TcCL_NonESM08607 [Trypanosoma cruzi]|nr:hypothetical protein TcCL_NonESM08607 [Trypanosoma cruzi]
MCFSTSRAYGRFYSLFRSHLGGNILTGSSYIVAINLHTKRRMWFSMERLQGVPEEVVLSRTVLCATLVDGDGTRLLILYWNAKTAEFFFCVRRLCGVNFVGIESNSAQ